MNVRWWSYYFLTWNFLKIKTATHFCALKLTVLQVMWPSNKRFFWIYMLLLYNCTYIYKFQCDDWLPISVLLLFVQPSANKSPAGYNLHQLHGNKMHGSQKTGYLLKKSDGKVRKVWQRRKCIIHDGIMLVSHSDVRDINLFLFIG